MIFKYGRLSPRATSQTSGVSREKRSWLEARVDGQQTIKCKSGADKKPEERGAQKYALSRVRSANMLHIKS